MTHGAIEDTTEQYPAPETQADDSSPFHDNSAPPTLSLPQEGEIQQRDATFTVDTMTGSATLQIPIWIPPARNNFSPDVTLSYHSQAGSSPFGLGWQLSLPTIRRMTSPTPTYQQEEFETYLFNEQHELVPMFTSTSASSSTSVSTMEQQGEHQEEGWTLRTVHGVTYRVQRFVPRVEQSFARIERWTDQGTGQTHWRSISKEYVTHVYGGDEQSRIADPADTSHVFAWLLTQSWDALGNSIYYEYKQENAQQVDERLPYEQGRLTEAQGFAARYLKHIYYGNRTPFQMGRGQQEDWLMHVVFDYGEHAEEMPTLEEVSPWSCRLDPFSTFRPGFELRMYRLCRRVLLFHTLAELEASPCLVRATQLEYHEGRSASRLCAVTEVGYLLQADGRYERQALPPLTISSRALHQDEHVYALSGDAATLFPRSQQGSYQWAIPSRPHPLESAFQDELGQSSGRSTVFYQRNFGDAHFTQLGLTALRPLPPETPAGDLSLLERTQKRSPAQLQEMLRQFQERRERETSVQGEETLASAPSAIWNDPHLRYFDLDGDGAPDLLLTEDRALAWNAATAQALTGFTSSLYASVDQEHAPAPIFVDGQEAIYLADMTGDGLVDVVRIRNGEVCYWPNGGYGRFGRKITMQDAPRFATVFLPQQVRLADITGTGTTDVLYHDGEQVFYWFNQHGNSWSSPYQLSLPLPPEALSELMVFDLLGNGTACLVWPSSTSDQGPVSLRYSNLAGGLKEGLVEQFVNNQGREITIAYKPLAAYYTFQVEVF